MQYELNLIHDLCRAIGFAGYYQTPEIFAIPLAEGIVLVFQNSESEKDCLVAFEGTPWHCHGDFQFSDRHGYFLELSYLDVIKGLGAGSILLCEQWNSGVLRDRWLVHRDYIDEFRYMVEGEDIRIRRLPAGFHSASIEQAANEKQA
jgi:hypothetical protein